MSYLSGEDDEETYRTLCDPEQVALFWIVTESRVLKSLTKRNTNVHVIQMLPHRLCPDFCTLYVHPERLDTNSIVPV